MDEDLRDAERVRHRAGVLAARAAEGGQGVPGDVVPLLHRDPLDRVGHVGHGDAQVPLGDLLRAAAVADPRGQVGEPRADDVGVQRLVAVRPEHPREVLRLDAAEHHVGVGDGERAAAPVAGRAGVGTGRVRADPVPGAVEVQDRTAAGRDGVDVDHRRAQPHAGHLGVEDPLVPPGVVRDVGRGAAHVEADDVVEAGELRHPYHADDAAGRAGQDRVLAAEVPGLGQAAVGLHEHQPDAGQLPGDPVDVAAHNRGQVRVDDRRVTAGYQLHQRADLAAAGDLREAELLGHLAGGALVLRVQVAVQAGDGDRARPGVPGGPQVRGQRVEIGRPQDGAVRGDPLVQLDHPLVEHLRQHDVPVEDARPVLVPDPQRVTEALRDDQYRPLALAFQQRVGRHRGTHPDRFDAAFRRPAVQQRADTGDGGVAVPGRVLRQQLVRDQPAVRRPRDDVGEGTAAVDPELPAPHRDARQGARRTAISATSSVAGFSCSTRIACTHRSSAVPAPTAASSSTRPSRSGRSRRSMSPSV